RKILLELDKNARSSFAEIAKRVGVSKEVAKYRIEQLQARGFLEGFYAFANLPKLGFHFYKIYLRLQFTENEQEIIQYLKQHPQVSWLVVCDGKYDLIINVLTKTVNELDEFLIQFRSKFGTAVQALDVTIITNFVCCDRVYLTEVKNNPQEFFLPNPQVHLDHLDVVCLDYLSQNARISLTDLSKKLNVSIETIRKRIQRLVKEKIIQKFTIKLNYPLFNYQYFKVMIKFQNLTQEKRERFVKYCLAHPNIVFLIEGIGVSDIDLDAELANLKSFHSLILDLKSKFGEIIKEYEILLISEEVKATYLSPVQYLID
ncbi:MAG: Lrp/AsnC family transcriptional regulator, partial [Candidatus Diapherotrites archaeon]|nr:Lrp/AsnC family transcriptional regulator [Candidatus Diapherotrites archaeon]